VLRQIIREFYPNTQIATWSALPFLIYPSAMSWYTQIHKDGFSILGYLLITYGLIFLFKREQGTEKLFQSISKPVFLIFSGFFLLFFIRPYQIKMLQGFLVVLLLPSIFLLGYWKFRLKMGWSRILVSLGIFFATLYTTTLVRYVEAYRPPGDLSTSEFSPKTEEKEPEKETSYAYVKRPNGELIKFQSYISTWDSSSWLPEIVDSKIYHLARVREGFRSTRPDQGTNIDLHIGFHNANEFFAYLPRAFEISLLAPFPKYWFEKAHFAPSSARKISGIEMVGVYFSLLFFVLAIFRWRKSPPFWVFFVLTIGMLITYGSVITNVGSLYRYRYGQLMAVMAFGVAEFLYRTRRSTEKIRSSL
jgi:putative peptidoglycan lipid II flippase